MYKLTFGVGDTIYILELTKDQLVELYYSIEDKLKDGEETNEYD